MQGVNLLQVDLNLQVHLQVLQVHVSSDLAGQTAFGSFGAITW